MINLPAVQSIEYLRKSLVAEIGESAASTLKDKFSTLGETLDLLRVIRNVTTAHGRAEDLKDSSLYTWTLALTLHLMTQLPWSAAMVAHLSADGDLIGFHGCLPHVEKGIGADGPDSGTYVVIGGGEGDDKQMKIDAEEFFRVDETQASVAMYIGESGFFDPLAGARVEEEEGGYPW